MDKHIKMNKFDTVKNLIYKITLPKVVNSALAVAGLVNLGSGSYYMVTGNGTLAGVGISAGLILLMASTIDRFESLKGLGMEAKTRELSQKLNQADVVLEKMKRLAEVTGGTLVKLAASNGRLGVSTPAVEAYELTQSVKQILKDVGTEADAIRTAVMPWAFYACFDMSYAIINKYRKKALESMQSFMRQYPQNGDTVGDFTYSQLTANINLFSLYIDSTVENLSQCLPSGFSEKLRSFLANMPACAPVDALAQLSADIDKWAPEMDYLAQHLEFKNRESWIQGLEME